MAIEEDTRVFEQVKFDGDWPKAGAIDTAMQYANYMVDEMRRRMAATARGHIGVPPAHFTEVTALFESVLNQQGYMIVSNESWKDLDGEVRELIRISSDTAKHSAEVHEKLSQREEELDQALATIKKLRDSISLLTDEQNSGNSEPEQQGTFVVSRCPTPNPYSPTGEPCVLSHREDPHSSARGGEFWTQHAGLTEEQARAVKEFNQQHDSEE